MWPGPLLVVPPFPSVDGSFASSAPPPTPRPLGVPRDKIPIAAIARRGIGSRQAGKREDAEGKGFLRVPKAIWLVMLLSGMLLTAGIVVLAIPA